MGANRARPNGRWRGAARPSWPRCATLIGAPADTPLVVADADEPGTLDAMCHRARVVLTTVGPYQLYGSELVAAATRSGTDYADLCGEPAWMREMIDAHHDHARASGARIAFSSGFDSIPFDLGVLMLQQEAVKRFGKPAPRVRGRVRDMKGTFSGGTAASLTATMKAIAKNPKLALLLQSPFALTPGFEGPDQPMGLVPHYEDDLGRWAAPFIMATINVKNVHRTNFLAGFPYGEDFRYDEMMLTSPGEAGKAAANAVAGLLKNPFGVKPPAPGEGPTPEERENGFYDVLFVGEMSDGREAALRGQGALRSGLRLDQPDAGRDRHRAASERCYGRYRHAGIDPRRSAGRAAARARGDDLRSRGLTARHVCADQCVT